MTDTDRSATRHAADLASLATTFWEDVLRDDPLFATSIGERGHDARLPDPTAMGRAARRARAETHLAAVREIPADALSPVDRVTHSALEEALVGEAARLATGIDDWSVDQLEGPQQLFLDIEAFQPVSDPAQGRAMVERWRAMGPYVDAYAAELRAALAGGRVAVRTPVLRVLDQLDALAATPEAEEPLLAPARAGYPDWDAPVRDAFRADLAAAVMGTIRPAFARLRTTLADGILPAARPDDRPGICHLAGGAEAYARLIRYHTSLEIPAEILHAIGLAEIERIDAEFVDLGGRVLGTRDLDATLARLREDPALRFSSRAEIVAVAEDSLARARAAIPAAFGILPRADCIVVRIGSHEETHSTIAYYRQPAVDGTRPGQYFVNTSAPETRPRYEAEALAFHESIPGHHLQIAIAQELEGIPEFRRHLGPTAYVEGWGLYTERLSEEMGLYSGDLDRFGILSFDAWRACRLIVDTGMHAFGWTRGRAIDFVRTHTALGENNIANEVDRYIAWPGQALAYKTGQLEILRLRDEARAALGTGFDLRGFHDAVLGAGAVPLATLDGIVASWTDSTRA